MDYGRWNEWDGVLTEGNKMKHQWVVDWRKWDKTWIMKFAKTSFKTAG